MIAYATILMDVLILGGLAWWLYKRQSLDNRFVFCAALTIKVIAGMVLGWIYFFYYQGQGDTLSYWHDGKLIAEKILREPSGAMNFFWNESPDSLYIPELINDMPRSFFFSKISGVLALLSSGNYWIMATMLSVISFLAAWYLFLKTIEFFPSSRLAAAVAFLFFPTVVFWSSGLIKESLGLASLLLMTGVLFTVMHGGKTKVWEWMVVLLSIWMGWNLKYYWMGIFLPIALALGVVSVVRRYNPQIARFDILVGLGVLSVLLLFVTNIHPNFYPSRFLEVICENNQEFMALSDVEDVVRYTDFKPTLYSLLTNSPQALAAGFFRPFVWESHNVLSALAGVENLVVLVLVLTALPGLRNVLTSPNRLEIMATIGYCIVLAIFLALSTPNLGTLSRYKIGFTPFLIFLTLFGGPFSSGWTQRRR